MGSTEETQEHKAVFLDRDGTLNVDSGFVGEPERVVLLPGVPRALARLCDAGYLLIVVTNQSGVARGMFDEHAVLAVNRRIEEWIRAEAPSVRFAGWYVCPHHPEGAVARHARRCVCRKPAPGLIERALREHGVDRRASVLIGDSARDIEAARRAGLGAAIRLGEDRETGLQSDARADAIVTTLEAASDWILEWERA